MNSRDQELNNSQESFSNSIESTQSQLSMLNQTPVTQSNIIQNSMSLNTTIKRENQTLILNNALLSQTPKFNVTQNPLLNASTVKKEVNNSLITEPPLSGSQNHQVSFSNESIRFSISSSPLLAQESIDQYIADHFQLPSEIVMQNEMNSPPGNEESIEVLQLNESASQIGSQNQPNSAINEDS